MLSPTCELCRGEMRPGTRGSPKRYCSGTCRRIAWAIRHLPPEHRAAAALPEEPEPVQLERDPALFRPIYQAKEARKP